jgi:alpha-beta hydrolase superfamily lysophospholipase
VPSPRGVVLHVHGYNDYFFQTHLADAARDAGFLFYAVDTRTAGRALQDGDIPHHVTDLRDQGRDIVAALRVIRAQHPGLPVALHAHSTGGLTAACLLDAFPGVPPATCPSGVGGPRANPAADDGSATLMPDALVLNSPFLELPTPVNGSLIPDGTTLAGRAVRAAVRLLGAVAPTVVVDPNHSAYGTAQLDTNGGRWFFDERLKNPDGQPTRAGWVAAVLAAQARVTRGLDIACPVLLAASTASSTDDLGNPRLDASDTVLDVDRLVTLAPKLGRRVAVMRIDGGVHDLSLSDDGPRDRYITGVLHWLANVLPAPTAGDR